MDFSSLLVLQDRKFYHINGTEAPLEEIYAENGITMSRQRLWAGKNQYDLDANIYLAKRAQKVGMSIFLNVFTNNDWTDPGKIQCFEKEWGNSTDQIRIGIYNYFLLIGNRFANEGIIPKYISLGNEITNGICPNGRMSVLPSGPKNTAIFLQAAADGIHHSKLGSKSMLMLHIDLGWNSARFINFLDKIHESGQFNTTTGYHAVGMSAYPYWNGPKATQINFKNTIKLLQERYKKQVLIVESAWPLKCTRRIPLPADTAGMTFSTQGQEEWIKMLGNTAKDADATAMAWWEGSWLTNTAAGSRCESTLLFDEEGRALPSLAAFKKL